MVCVKSFLENDKQFTRRGMQVKASVLPVCTSVAGEKLSTKSQDPEILELNAGWLLVQCLCV